MTKIIIFIIQIYYKLFPEESRRVCIHSESCSKYVNRVANEHGGIKAIMAYYSRYKSCNANYEYYKKEDGRVFIKTKNGMILEENQINPFLLRGIQSVL